MKVQDPESTALQKSDPSGASQKGSKTLNSVGSYIKQKRQQKGLSQRSLGQALIPAVTTQFISNIERGVTPLPTDHIAKLIQVLSIPEQELLQLLEAEYSAKISKKMGLPGVGSPNISQNAQTSQGSISSEQARLRQAFERAAAAFSAAPPETQAEVRSALMRLLQVAV